jgi:hypothetical protein
MCLVLQQAYIWLFQLVAKNVTLPNGVQLLKKLKMPSTCYWIELSVELNSYSFMSLISQIHFLQSAIVFRLDFYS